MACNLITKSHREGSCHYSTMDHCRKADQCRKTKVFILYPFSSFLFILIIEVQRWDFQYSASLAFSLPLKLAIIAVDTSTRAQNPAFYASSQACTAYLSTFCLRSFSTLPKSTQYSYNEDTDYTEDIDNLQENHPLGGDKLGRYVPQSPMHQMVGSWQHSLCSLTYLHVIDFFFPIVVTLQYSLMVPFPSLLSLVPQSLTCIS